jgi:hypothetical protein
MASSKTIAGALRAATVSNSYHDHQSGVDTIAEDMQKLSLHNHKPLMIGTRSIRLLEVHTRPGYDPIRCTLSQHLLDDEPQYIALSYTWNQGGRRRVIECDGMKFEIGENLWHFLCEFRRKQYLTRYHSAQADKDKCYLWIDAICIDQGNLQERNHQVAQMRDVYTSALSIIVWLGLAVAHEELAFLLTRHPDLLQVRDFQVALLSLFNKPYFTRVWV